MTAPRDPLLSDSTTVMGGRQSRGFGSGGGDKPTYLTTEFLVFVVFVLGLLLTAIIVQDTDDHEDYFRADRAWLYVTLLGIAYILSRGLSKLGRNRDRD